MEAFDSLPPDVRDWLAKHKANVPATRIYEKYVEFGCNEEELWVWVRSIRILSK